MIELIMQGIVVDHFFLFIYIISVGVTFAVVSLSLLYWMQKNNKGRFNTLLFISYLAILLIVAGFRFYWEELLSGGRGVTLGISLAEFVGYGLLLYYLPATVNLVVGRTWTPLRLAASITASAVYAILGTVYHFTGYLAPISLAAAFLYFLALGIILVDIVRGIPLIQKVSIRATVLLATLLTLAFLPLVLIARLVDGSDGFLGMSESLRFLILSLYYFWMALTGIVFYIREMAGITEKEKKISGSHENLPLTDRENDIAESVAQGLTYGEIAENLGISPNTVRNHVANVYKKLAVRSKVELISVLRGERAF